ncbi:unnamed protein product [Meloidogyne enterolobii]|uniref:Uncharacterized protein n=1 Tax=Meloidogyne enterolobii TaxID=390850 RepID=A0ACB0Y1I8_MELEN
MSAPPVPYRAESNSQQYTPSFPPPVYYRDTFGLEPVEYLQGDCITDSDDESGTTKSTVRHHNFVRIFHPGPSTSCQTIEHRPSLPFSQIPRRKSGFSTTTSNHATIPEDQTSQPSTLQSMQMEELLLTDKILFVRYARPFLWLSTVLLGVALQLLIFSIVCVFFDGYWAGICISIFLLINSVLLIVFMRYKQTRIMIWICMIFSTISVLLSIILFTLCTYFTYEDSIKSFSNNDEQQIVSAANDNIESNKIVQNARCFKIKENSFICGCACLLILLINYSANNIGQVHKGLFLSRTAGHQNVLVPVKLRQVAKIENGEVRSE